MNQSVQYHLNSYTVLFNFFVISHSYTYTSTLLDETGTVVKQCVRVSLRIIELNNQY